MEEFIINQRDHKKESIYKPQDKQLQIDYDKELEVLSYQQIKYHLILDIIKFMIEYANLGGSSFKYYNFKHMLQYNESDLEQIKIKWKTTVNTLKNVGL